MKKIFKSILLIFFITSSLSAQEFWLPLNSPTRRPLRSCSFIDSLRGWVSGDSGFIMRTTNGGINWIIQNPGITENIHAIYFVNEKYGWGLGWIVAKMNQNYGTRILYTTNGGTNWLNYFYPTENVFYNTIYFTDSLHGWIGGYPESIYKSVNGGMNWTPATIDTSGPGGFPVRNITFYNKKFGFAGGGFYDIAGAIWKSSDYGNTWYAKGVSPEPMTKMIAFDSLDVMGIGGDYEFGPGLVTTSNGGINWNYTPLLSWGIPTSAAFRTRQEGWITLGYVPNFLLTRDSAQNFQDYPTPDNSYLFDITFPDTKHGYCVGDSGKVFKFNYASVNIKDPGKDIIPSLFKLHQNYPNPFNPETNIIYDVPFTSHIKISVYDILGKELEILLNKKQYAGSYGIKWNASKYPSGLYFYRLVSEYFSASKCMILVK